MTPRDVQTPSEPIVFPGGSTRPETPALGASPSAPTDQPSAPYLDAVVAYGFRGSTRFHVPGHKAGAGADPGLRSAIGWSALALDVPQDIEGIDLAPPTPTPYERAEQLAAEAHGARRTWFLTNGATQGNHALCLAVAPPGASVVVQRNSHASVIDGLVLSGGRPTFVAPEYDDELGMAHGLTPDMLAAAFARAPDARAALIVSPTYYGLSVDIAGCAAVAHEHGAALVVDQAWGSHFGFHSALPPSALHAGADAVLTSTHKIVGSLTQTALLHVGDSDRVDAEQVGRSLRLLRSTSQSSLLMASLDAARRQLVIHGEQLLTRTMATAARARAAIDAIDGCRVVGEGLVGRPGVAGWDPLRIVIDIRDTGCSGYELATGMRVAYDVQIELATHATLVIVLGLDQPVEPLERFAYDFERIVRRMRRPGRVPQPSASPANLDNEVVLSPREAFLGTAEMVPVANAPGRISAETIAGYPPGIPALLPGERISVEVVDYLREIHAAGARLHGASDPSFQAINVVR